MRLAELGAKFTQVMPLADGIYTGLYYRCPNDPAGKRAHAILFKPPIVPREYGEIATPDRVEVALSSNESWRAQPKWDRSGETIDTLTIAPSIARSCCHLTISNGEVNSQ